MEVGAPRSEMSAAGEGKRCSSCLVEDSNPRARFVDAMRDVLSDRSGVTDETSDGSSPDAMGARRWFARLRDRDKGTARLAANTDDADDGIDGVISWMLARLDDATEDVRRAQSDERQTAETRLAHVRASHETRLRALDARHRAALDAWKRDELERARNAARDAVRQARDDAERVVRETRASLAKAETRADFAETRADFAETEAATYAQRLELCISDANDLELAEERRWDIVARRMRARALFVKVYLAWRLAGSKRTEEKYRAEARDAVAETAAALKEAQSVRNASRVAFVLCRARARVAFLRSTGFSAFNAWRRAVREALFRKEEAAAKQKNDRRAARWAVFRVYRKRSAEKHVSGAFRAWRACAVRSIETRALDRVTKRRAEDTKRREESEKLASVCSWVSRRTQKIGFREWRIATFAVAAAADAELLSKHRETSRVSSQRRAVRKWIACVHRTRRASVTARDVSNRATRRAFLSRWRARVSETRSLRARAARHQTLRVLNRCGSTAALNADAAAAFPPLASLAMLHRAFNVGNQDRGVRVWSRVLDPEDTHRTLTRALVHRMHRLSSFRDSRARVTFATWRLRTKSRVDSRRDVSENARYLRALRPMRASFTRWLRFVIERQTIGFRFAKRLEWKMKRKALQSWWVLAAEVSESGGSPLAGEDDANDEDDADEKSMTRDAAERGRTYPSWRRALLALRWETPRGRPVSHWLGNVLSAAARFARVDSTGGFDRDGIPKSKRETVLSRALARRVLVCGERLNRQRDARLAALDTFRGVLEGATRVYGGNQRATRAANSPTRPLGVAWTRARGAEEEALRVLRDVMDAFGDFFENEKNPKSPRPESETSATSGKENETFHGKGEASGDARGALPRIPRRGVAKIGERTRAR